MLTSFLKVFVAANAPEKLLLVKQTMNCHNTSSKWIKQLPKEFLVNQLYIYTYIDNEQLIKKSGKHFSKIKEMFISCCPWDSGLNLPV